MLITPYFSAVSPFASTSNLPTVTLPSFSCAICSTMGAIILHGPHHVAQKSTNTTPWVLSTSFLKVASVKTTGFDIVMLLLTTYACAAHLPDLSTGLGACVNMTNLFRCIQAQKVTKWAGQARQESRALVQYLVL